MEQGDAESSNVHDKETDSPSDDNNKRLGKQVVADEHQPEHPLLGTDVSCQLRGINRLVTDEHQLTANPLVTRDHQGSASKGLSNQILKF